MSEHQLWTIGHSNRQLDEVLDLLTDNQVEAVADVRRFPGSRRSPQFGRDAFAEALRLAGLAYHHFPDLGGRRKSLDEPSPNNGWRVAAFRAYADYMLTPEFAVPFEELANLAEKSRTAIMCAEAVPWRCHRRLIADRFIVRGWRVWDIVGRNQVKEHQLPPFAKVMQGELLYPAD